MDNVFLNWLLDNWELISAIIAFAAYFRFDKRRREAEARQSEGSALSTMQEAYDRFTADYIREFDKLKQAFDALWQSKTETESALNLKIRRLEQKLGSVEKERVELLKRIRHFELQAEKDKTIIDGLTLKIENYEKELARYRMDMQRFSTS